MCDLSMSEGNLLFWDDRLVRSARKEHRCDGCLTRIPPRQSYSYFRAISEERDFIHERMCADCWFVRTAFGESHDWWPTPSYLASILRDCIIGDEASAWRDALAGLIRRRRRATREARS